MAAISVRTAFTLVTPETPLPETPPLIAGRIDAYLADSPVVDYAVKVTGDKFQKVGEDQDAALFAKLGLTAMGAEQRAIAKA